MLRVSLVGLAVNFTCIFFAARLYFWLFYIPFFDLLFSKPLVILNPSFIHKTEKKIEINAAMVNTGIQ